jgi:hypothetical protein
VLCALFLNLSINILLRIAAIFLSNINSTSAPKSSHYSASKSSQYVLLIDGQGVCHGRPYLSEMAHCTAISSDLQPFGKKINCGPKFWEIPLRQWKIPLKEGNLGAN